MRITRKRPELNSHKILIIDDDEGIIDSICVFLERNGYDVFGMTRPLEGLEELTRNKYDLLILDYFMPLIKGDDFVSKLREFDREIYVMLLTGHKDLAPPLSTIRALDIQAYCEKSPRLDQLLLLIESGMKSIDQMRRIQKYRDGLNDILEALPKIYQLKPLKGLFEEILHQMLSLNNCEDAFILVSKHTEEEWHLEESIYEGVGKYNVTLEEFTTSFAPVFLEAMNQSKTKQEVVSIDNGIVLPLVRINGVTQGVIYAAKTPDITLIELLKIFANQAAASIQNAQLHSILDQKTDELIRAYSAIKTNYIETIEALRQAVDAKDVYTRGHSDRVSMYAKIIGQRLGMCDEDVEKLRIGGMFHDIGKIGTSEDILLKDERLTDAEYEEIKRHPRRGATILSAISSFSEVEHYVHSHHERFDGCGYPDGLSGEAIPLGARIICVADAFDAMTSDRMYRNKLEKRTVLDQLKLGRGTQFDQRIVDCFIDMIENDLEDIQRIATFK